MASLEASPKNFRRRYSENTAKLAGLIPAVLKAGSPDEIHDFRVAIRRVQVMHKLMPREVRRSKATRDLDAVLRTYLKSTSSLRDNDILRKTFAPDWASLPRELVDSLERDRNSAQQIARNAMTKLPKKLPHALTGSSRISGSKLSKRFGARVKKQSQVVRKLLPGVLRDESKVEELHALRKQAKRLRYLLEISDRKIPEEQVLTRWQDDLGEIHDLDVAQEYLKKLRDPRKAKLIAALASRRHSIYLRFSKSANASGIPRS